MSKGKIAVAVVHGIGEQREGFEAKLAKSIYDLCRDDCKGEPETEIVIRGVHWAKVLNSRQSKLRDRIDVDELRGPWAGLRRFLVSFAGDAVGYQDSGGWVYKGIHTKFAMTLRELADATAPNAPLIIIAHSLGTVITSNFLWDLQKEYRAQREGGQHYCIPKAMRSVWGDSPTPLERGQTLTLLYTLGSPIGLWSLKYINDDENVPIDAPPNIGGWAFRDMSLDLPVGWINMYDKEDIIGYPLGGLNEAYAERVEDRLVRVGNLFTDRTPISHVEYFGDKDVTREISRKIIQIYQRIDGGELVLDTVE